MVSEYLLISMHLTCIAIDHMSESSNGGSNKNSYFSSDSNNGGSNKNSYFSC